MGPTAQLPQVAASCQLQQLVGKDGATLRIASGQRRLGERLQAAQGQPDFAVFQRVLQSRVQRRLVTGSAQSQLGHRQIGLQSGQPVLNAGLVRQPKALLKMLQRLPGQIQIEEQATQSVVRHDLVSMQAQCFQPGKRFV